MNIGNYIRDLRIKSGYTQEELGALVGVQRAAVQKWESGMTQNLKRTTIQKLAETFKVSPSSFISDNIEPTTNAEDSLLPVYLSFAQSAQDEGILPEDIEMALNMIKQLKKRGDD